MSHFYLASSFSKWENEWSSHWKRLNTSADKDQLERGATKTWCSAIFLCEFKLASQVLEEMASVVSGSHCQETSPLLWFLILQVMTSMSLLPRVFPDDPKDLSFLTLAFTSLSPPGTALDTQEMLYHYLLNG